MAAPCVPTPVQTQYETSVITSQSTSFSISTSTIPAELTTFHVSTCLQTLSLVNSNLCLQSTVIDSVSTVHGVQTNTVQVPIVLNIFSTQLIPTKTVLQSCSASSPSDSPSPSPSPSLTPTTPPTTSSTPPSTHPPNQSFVTSSVLILSTPPPSTSVISSSITLPNGQISVIYQTNVYSQEPTSVYVITTALVSESQASGGPSDTNLGPIIGGTLGGLSGLFLVVALLWCIRRRQPRFDTVFEKNWGEDDLRAQALERSKARFSIENEPQPYQYGLIGRGSSTKLLHDASPIIPSLELSSTAPNMTSYGSSQPSSRRPSTSAGSLALFLSPDPMKLTTDRVTVHTHADIGSESKHGSSSLPPRISINLDDRNETASLDSPVSVHWPRNLIVVNQHEDE